MIRKLELTILLAIDVKPDVRHRFATLLAVLGFAFVAGCHSASTPQSNAPAPLDDAWLMSSPGEMKIQLPSGPSRRPEGIHIDVRVLVDSAGHPNMGTLRISGAGADENRDMLTRRIRESTFKPSPKNPDGHPGYYHMRIYTLPP